MTQAAAQWTFRGRRLLALAAAIFMSGLLFLVIPMTQYLNDPNNEIVSYRKMIVAMPPPPSIPPPPEIEPEVEELEPEPPTLEQQFFDVPIQQLGLSLSPGIGVALAMGVPSVPRIETVDVAADIERIFNFDELSQVPTLLNAQMIRADFPRELSRQGVRQAKVVLEILIDERGRVRVTRVLSASHQHPKLHASARKAASQARFSVTKVDGRPVTVRGRFPIALQAPR